MAELLFDQKSLIEWFAALNILIHENPWITGLLMYLLGTCVGSFLNVLAIRSLKEESILWPSSYCPSCNHPLKPWDNIPVISYIMLGGRCRYCREGISWQYPFVEVCTGLLYAGITYVFILKRIPLENFDAIRSSAFSIEYTRDLFHAIQHGKNLMGTLQTLDANELWFYKFGLFLGCLSFASTLVAVCITDFREKLIPHEITYPSMLVGIAFSALIRGDLMGAMAGIGASYIIFDFMAFYGRYPYIWMNMLTKGKENHEADAKPETEQTANNPEGDPASEPIVEEVEEEEIEVMGGGDAVLSAVMSAYLGWQGLVLALIIGFMSGAVMGLVYLTIEMKKAGILKECGQKSLIFAIGFGTIMAGFTYLMMSGFMAENPEALIKTTLNSFLMSSVAGALLGMIWVGTRVSKPFPFGPALALGGLIAMFLIPYWLPFY